MGANQTSFKPGNKAYDLSQMGRPEYWTEEKIEGLVIKLHDWLEKDDSICMAGFRGENSLTPNVMDHIRKKSAVFSSAYKNAQQIVANRMAVKLGNGVHQAHYNKYQSCYDSELKEHEKEMMAAKEASQEEERKRITEAGKLGINLILDQMQSYRSDRNIEDNISIKE